MIFRNKKGVFLIITALALPGMIYFWGWVLSETLGMKLTVSQQIGADATVLSAAQLEANLKPSNININARDNFIQARAQILFSFYTPAATPTVTISRVTTGSGPNRRTVATVGLSNTLTNQPLFLQNVPSITTSAQAKEGATSAILLPLS